MARGNQFNKPPQITSNQYTDVSALQASSNIGPSNSLQVQNLGRGGDRGAGGTAFSDNSYTNQNFQEQMSGPGMNLSIGGQGGGGVPIEPYGGSGEQGYGQADAVMQDDDGVPDDGFDEYEDDSPEADPLPQNVSVVRVNGKEYYKHKQTGGLLSIGHGELVDDFASIQDKKFESGRDDNRLSVTRVSDGQLRETTYGVTDNPEDAGSRAGQIISALGSQDTVRSEGKIKREIMDTINTGGFGFSQGDAQTRFSGVPNSSGTLTPDGGTIPNYANPDFYSSKTYSRPQTDPTTGKGTGARDPSGNLIMEQFQSKPPAQNKEVQFYSQLGSGPSQRVGTIPGSLTGTAKMPQQVGGIGPGIQTVPTFQNMGAGGITQRTSTTPSKGGLSDVFNFYKTRTKEQGGDTGFISEMQNRWSFSNTKAPKGPRVVKGEGGATSGLSDPMGFFAGPPGKSNNPSWANLNFGNLQKATKDMRKDNILFENN